MVVARLRLYFTSLALNFGYHFSLTLVSIYLLLKGAMYTLVLNAALPYFKSLGVSGVLYQSYLTFSAMPWALKAFLGLLSDSLPLFGYHKLSYIFIFSIIGTSALAVLAFFPIPASMAVLAATLLLFVNLQVAAVDLLAEAKYAELMVAKPETGSDVVSFVWAMYSLGSLFASSISGPLTDRFKPSLLYLIGVPLAAQVLIPVIAGWFPDERVTTKGIRYDKLSKYPDLVKLSVAMSIGALLVGFSAASGIPLIQSSISVSTAITLAVLGFVWLPPTLRKANLYLFLSNMLYISLSGALDYWMTSDDSCVVNGPNFSMTYYITYANIIGSIAGLLGVALFQRTLSHGTFRMAFLVTGLIKLVASMFDVILVKRWNLSYLNVSDKSFFILGDAVIVQVVGMLELMPAVVLTSKVVPKGMESTVYALLVSYQNLGSGVSSTIGVELIRMLGIKTTVPCNFDHLPLAIVIGHVALPFISFVLVFFLIPDAKMTDDLSPDGNSSMGLGAYHEPGTDDLTDAFATYSSDEENGEPMKHGVTVTKTGKLPSDTESSTTVTTSNAEKGMAKDSHVQLIENGDSEDHRNTSSTQTGTASSAIHPDTR